MAMLHSIGVAATTMIILRIETVMWMLVIAMQAAVQAAAVAAAVAY